MSVGMVGGDDDREDDDEKAETKKYLQVRLLSFRQHGAHVWHCLGSVLCDCACGCEWSE